MIGLVVNPIAGIGGRVGLKGSDGDAWRLAIKLGAEPVAPKRAVEFLKALAKRVEIATYPKLMGEFEAIEAGYRPYVVGEIGEETSAEDTKRACRELMGMVDLIVFVGGDGTARDVLDAVGTDCLVLGVPSGVKVYSSCFAMNPEYASKLVLDYLEGRGGVKEAEVLDIDEEAFRRDRLRVRLYGYLKIPYELGLVQAGKEPSRSGRDVMDNLKGIARYLKEVMDDSVYVLGPGSTVKHVAEFLGIEKTLLGVDVVWRGRVLKRDANEEEIIEAIKGRRAKLVVTPIGGQGFIFGRGNQQISPRVLRMIGKEGIIVVGTKEKMRKLKSLHVDTGDRELDEELKGWMRVITDYREEEVFRVD